ncbi:MAG: 50S ribosomal protein L34 [Patescibacteria group bacterium]
MLEKLKKRARLKTHGFRQRSATVLSARRAKGRKQLTVSIPKKK